jgi:protein-S-isoprenylcysteine O-methyltransferase Ste14
MTSGSQLDGKSSMGRLVVKTLMRVVLFVLIMAGIWYLASGRLDWVMAWAFLIFYAVGGVIAALIAPLDQELIEERTQIKEGVKDWDKPIALVLSVLYPLGMLILAGLDVRFGWLPPISLPLQIFGLVLVVLSNLFAAWAVAANKFYARFVRIQKERGHTVVTDGPYRYVRHPGYVGTIITFLAMALTLGSLWALILGGLMALVMIIRTALEDRTLQEELPGYAEYAKQTRYRLLPGIW